MSAYRILLVDDDQRSLKLIEAIYLSEGYETHTAQDGREAMEILLKQQIDLVITDIFMPNIDGYYLCYKIRTNPKLNKIPVIIYTATYVSQGEEKIAFEMGADRFIRKPAPKYDLISAAQDVLRHPEAHSLTISRTAESFDMMHQFSSDLVTRLEHRNIELEKMTDDLTVILERFSQSERIAHLGHWTLDLKTQKVIWSDELFRIHGLEPEAEEASYDLFMKYLHPEDRERVAELIAQATRDLTPLTFVHRIVRPNGEVRNAKVSCVFEIDRDKEPVRLIGITLDITELNEKEQKLEQAYTELANFIYKAHHDLKSPISNILGVLDMAKREIKDPKALEYFNLIEEVATKQQRMMENLMKVMSVRDHTPQKDEFSMTELINEVLQHLRETPNFKKVKFQISDTIESTIYTDRKLLYGILRELVENAVIYQSPDRAEVKIVIAMNEKNVMTLEIEDNGIGIPADLRRNVFDMFFRGTSISKGSGLGLYYVKNVVQRLGGEIRLSSKVGEGSAFVIILPL